MALHAHREGHLIFLVEGPDAAIRVGCETQPLDARTAAAVSPWQPHNFISLAAGNPSVYLVLYIKPAWFLEASRQVNAALRFGRSRIEVTDQVARLATQAAATLMDDPDEAGIGACLFELTQACFDQSWQWVDEGPSLMRGASPVRDYRVRNSVRLMQSRLGDHVVLDDIARDSGLSRPHFYKLFREQVGLTPNIYLNTLRMESALDRLTSSQDAVTDIGLDLGFASQASFTRFFIANSGIAPSDYRRVVAVGGR